MFVPEAPHRKGWAVMGKNDECTDGTEITVRDIGLVMNIMMKCLCV